jgi:hypothetical protein
MSRVNAFRWGPVSLLASLLITILLPILGTTSVAFAATSCSWTSSTQVSCGGETFTNPTTNGNTVTLTTGQSNTAANGTSTCAGDSIAINTTNKTAVLTTVKATTTGKYSGGCSNTTTQATMSNTAATAAGASSTTANGSAQADTTALTCGSGALSWIICPVITLAVDSANKLDSFIMNSLNVDVTPIFDDTSCTNSCASGGYYTAWNQFRIIATGLLVIGGLVMVTSQALGFELLDAYTVRKVLPRILVAAIGISLSWQLMRFVILFFDTLGFDLRNLMYSPFSNLKGTLSVSGGILTTLGAGAALFIIGPASLTFILTALLAVFVGFLIIIIRQIAIVMLIIVAPIAIACYILPNTQKVWKLWYDNFLGLMLMFPIISGLIAAGHIYAAVALKPAGANGPTGSLIAQGTAIIAYFAPYFLLPMAARMATGIIGNLAGFVNNAHKGAFDRLKGVRTHAAQERHKARMEGSTRFGSGLTGNIYRRTALAGREGSWSVTGKGRAKFEQNERKLSEARAAEALKNDNGRSAGDDIANEVAQIQGINSRSFVNQYADRALAQGQATTRVQAEQQGRDAMGLLETGYDAKIGSQASQVAAFKAQQMSVTGYGSSDEEYARRMNDAKSMVDRGYMNASDAMATIKQNKGRVEASGMSFGTGLQMLTQDGPIGQPEVNTMMNSAMDGLTPQSLVGARREAVIMYSRHLSRRLENTVNTVTAMGGNPLTDAGVRRQVGYIASVQDTINAQAPQNARAMADGLLTQPIGTTGLNVREFSDQLRGAQDVEFNNVRKEWLGGVPPGVPPGAPGGP